jgi:hypothetical protein
VTERRLPNGRVFVIVNESREWVTTTPQRGRTPARLLDLETGGITAAPRALALPPWGSVCLLEDGATAAGPPAAVPDRARALPIAGEWEIRKLRQVLIRDGDFANTTFDDAPARPVKLGDWRDTLGADFSGTAEYRIRFDYRGRDRENRLVDLGNVAAAAEVWLNGEPLGARAWQPFWFGTKQALRPGENELRIQVTNTLANYLTSPAVRADWASHKGPGWPGPYDGRANAFERQSTASGLFGPVVILSWR